MVSMSPCVKIVFLFLSTTLVFYMSKKYINIFLPQYLTKNSCCLIHWYFGHCQKSHFWKMFSDTRAFDCVWNVCCLESELGTRLPKCLCITSLFSLLLFINFNVNLWWKSQIATSFLVVTRELGFLNWRGVFFLWNCLKPSLKISVLYE